MDTRITKDFFSSFATLTPKEQKQSTNTLFQICDEKTNSGLRFHKIKHSSNKIFSYSVNKDIRIITHLNKKYIDLLYIGHHDDSYNWIGKRRLLSNDENLKLIHTSKDYSFSKGNDLKHQIYTMEEKNDGILSSMGNSAEFKEKIKLLKNDDEVLSYIETIPKDLQDELLDFVVKNSNVHQMMPTHEIYLLTKDDDLAKALKFPLEKWRLFLHPTQKYIAQLPIGKSKLITGGPGTGKTVCIIHRIANLVKDLGDNEIVILTTYKKYLREYLYKMLSMLDVDRNKVVIDDISVLKLLDNKEKLNTIAKLDGFYKIEGQKLYYFVKGEKYVVKHLLFDEYQDFTKSQITSIKEITRHTPFTIAFDYTQAIYRPIRSNIEELGPNLNDDILILNFCYRLNSSILFSIKQIVEVIKIAYSFQHRLKNKEEMELSPLENEIISQMDTIIDGPSPLLIPFQNMDDLDQKLNDEISKLSNLYDPDEILVTTFSEDLYLNKNKHSHHNIDLIPQGVRKYYNFICTLKGKEFKVGIVIFDDTICQMLNLNQSVFKGTVNTKWKGFLDNFRLNMNLLYVSLSRFRDYLYICYPEKYELVIEPLFSNENIN